MLYRVNLTRGQGDAPPPRPGHEGVMEHVEKCDLALLLPQHKEHLKEKWNKLKLASTKDM